MRACPMISARTHIFDFRLWSEQWWLFSTLGSNARYNPDNIGIRPSIAIIISSSIRVYTLQQSLSDYQIQLTRIVTGLISYQINAMAMAFYINNMSLASSIAAADSAFRYDNEINVKGQVYRELGDSGSYGYVVGTMAEFMLLARASKSAGVDMYAYVNKSTGFGNLRNSLAWMAPYCARGAECGNTSKFKTPQAQAKCIGWPYPAVSTRSS